MVTTNNKSVADKIRLLRSHGVTRGRDLMENPTDDPWYYEQIELGFNYRMTDIQAALGCAQLKRIETITDKRNMLALSYERMLQGFPLTTQKIHPCSTSSYHLYVVNLDKNINRRGVFDYLKSKNIGANVHYIPLYRHPYYKDLKFQKNDFPCCEQYYDSCITIPLFPELSNSDQRFIVDALQEGIQLCS